MEDGEGVVTELMLWGGGGDGVDVMGSGEGDWGIG